MVGVEDEDEKERIEEYFKQIQDAYAVGGWGEGRGAGRAQPVLLLPPPMYPGEGI